MSATVAKRFATRLQGARTRAGLTQADLAQAMSDRLGVTIYATTVTRIEATQRAVKIEEAAVIAEILAVPLESLVSDADAVSRRRHDLERSLADARRRARELEDELDAASHSIRLIQRELTELDSAQSHLGDDLSREALEDLRESHLTDSWPST